MFSLAKVPTDPGGSCLLRGTKTSRCHTSAHTNMHPRQHTPTCSHVPNACQHVTTHSDLNQYMSTVTRKKCLDTPTCVNTCRHTPTDHVSTCTDTQHNQYMPSCVNSHTCTSTHQYTKHMQTCVNTASARHPAPTCTNTRRHVSTRTSTHSWRIHWVSLVPGGLEGIC